MADGLGGKGNELVLCTNRSPKVYLKAHTNSHASTISKRLHIHKLVLTRTPSVQITQRVPSECVQNRYGQPQGYTCMGSAQVNNERLQDSQGQTLSVLTVAGIGFLRLCSCLCPNCHSSPLHTFLRSSSRIYRHKYQPVCSLIPLPSKC